MNRTFEQTMVGHAFGSGRSLRLSASARSGKTSTLVQMANATKRRGVYLAFNKAVATEAKARFPAAVHATTLHGMAFRPIVQRGYSVEKMTGSLHGGIVASKLGLKARMLPGGVECSAGAGASSSSRPLSVSSAPADLKSQPATCRATGP